MNLIDLIKLGESKTLELKEILPNNSSIAKTIIAFANTSGGKLVIGVSDDREIIGISEDNIFEVQDKIASIIFDSCAPNILPEIYTININGKLLLVIEVFRGNLLPYFLKSEGKNNGVYVRVGATNRKASIEFILELERQKRHISFDEEINYDIDLANLNLSSLKDQFKNIGKELNEKKLLNLKLIKEEHNKLYPTNALLIILGYYEHCGVKCARFKGLDMNLFIDKKEYFGNIFGIYENSLNFILNHLNLRGEITGIRRVDTYEIPLVAIREALTNALVHRDYINQGRDIKIAIYDDRLNIVSPGGFPNTITQQDIEMGRSEVKNKVLAGIFKELNMIEQWGTGIKRIKTACLEHGLNLPKINEKNDFVDVEFSKTIKALDTFGIPFESYRIISDTSENIVESNQNTSVNYQKSDEFNKKAFGRVSENIGKYRIVSDTDEFASVNSSQFDKKVAESDVKSSRINKNVAEDFEKSSDTDYKSIGKYRKVSESIGIIFDKEQFIIEYLKQNKLIVSKNVEQLLNIKEAMARRTLKTMLEKKLIVRLGSGKNTYYKIYE